MYDGLEHMFFLWSFSAYFPHLLWKILMSFLSDAIKLSIGVLFFSIQQILVDEISYLKKTSYNNIVK